ncbi:MAG: glycosyltransferase family 39 protein [Rhodospirillaceae bacterium]|nr:glycosyltransferase family 39 protein [Rhodospirillaceae bacterium]
MVLLLVYCGAHLALRLALSPIYMVDEAEQILVSQSLSLGYRVRHPPLLTWLTWGVIEATGDRWLAMHALKAAIMAAGFLAYFAAARRLVGSTWAAALATLSTTGFLAVGLLGQIDLPHTLLMTTMMAVVLWAGLRVTQRGGWGDYVVFGVAFGVGLLSKFYIVAFGVGLLAAMLAVPDIRRTLRWRRAVVAALVAAVIVAPTVVWTLAHLDDLSDAVQRSAEGGQVDPLETLGTYGEALIAFTLPVSVLWLVLLWPSAPALWRPLPAGAAQARRGLAVLIAVSAATFGLCLVAAGATTIPYRWMHPVLHFAPVLVALAVLCRPPHRWLLRTYVGSLWVLMLLFAAARMLQYLNPEDVSCPNDCRQHAPFPALGAQIGEAFPTRQGTMMAVNHFIGGNLFPWVGPEMRVVAPGFPPEIFPAPPDGGGDCLVVWLPNPADPTDLSLPGRLEAALVEDYGVGRETLAAASDDVRLVSAPLLRTQNQMYTLAVLHIPGGAGDCR